jgi:hypothetical protein
MIALDRDKGPVQMVAGMYDRIYASLYRNMLPIYLGQYPLFGDAQVMPVKVIWDYAFYWGIMCPLFIQNRLIDLPRMGRLQAQLAGIEKLNVAVQSFMRAWSRVSGREHNPARLLDQASLPWFAELNRSLTDKLDGPRFDARMTESGRMLNELAAEIVERATAQHPELDAAAVVALLPAGVTAGGRLFADGGAAFGETGRFDTQVIAHG